MTKQLKVKVTKKKFNGFKTFKDEHGNRSDLIVVKKDGEFLFRIDITEDNMVRFFSLLDDVTVELY